LARAGETSRHPAAASPTGNLDSRTSVEIMQIFQDLKRRRADHRSGDARTDVAQFAKRIVVFRDERSGMTIR